MSRLLTPSGYRDIADLAIGDEVSAFDTVTGAPITNVIETIEWVEAGEWVRWHTNAVLPPFTFYRINGRWTLNSEQSIWRNGYGVCHAKHLVVGNIIYDDADQPVTITSIAPIIAEGWWRFDISGDHSYIVDGLTLHNASRFWVGNGGTWDLATTTHWASSTGGSGGQTAPGSADTVTIDASSGTGTITPSFGGSGTFQSINCGAMGMMLDFSVNNNSVTLSAGGAINWSGTGARTIKLGSSTFSLTVTGSSSATPLASGTITNLVSFDAGTSIIDLTGTVTGGATRTLNTGALTYATIRISGSGLAGGYTMSFSNNVTIGNLIIAAPTVFLIATSTTGITFTNLTLQAQFILSINTSFTITNAPSISAGSPAAMSMFCTPLGGSPNTITLTNSGTISASWWIVQRVTFSGGTWNFTKSFDLGNNTGATITSPKYVSRSRIQSSGEAA